MGAHSPLLLGSESPSLTGTRACRRWPIFAFLRVVLANVAEGLSLDPVPLSGRFHHLDNSYSPNPVIINEASVFGQPRRHNGTTIDKLGEQHGVG